ncbi:MAG: LLM class flavin-dependent oxidoreductase [Rhodospirillales bacterium]|nr:LLM class flavin-dependent oxidoreductase [Rhodospirillales bacterium]
MKFHWFAEVTYPHLPADFRARGTPSWVTMPASLADPVKCGEMYRMFIRLMQQADRDGFDGLAVNEHHQTSFAVTPSPNLLAASLAGSTQNAAILVIGDSLALYNPPTRVAEEMAYLDCLSGGRLIAGFVFGRWRCGTGSTRRGSSSCAPGRSAIPSCSTAASPSCATSTSGRARCRRRRRSGCRDRAASRPGTS